MEWIQMTTATDLQDFFNTLGPVVMLHWAGAPPESPMYVPIHPPMVRRRLDSENGIEAFFCDVDPLGATIRRGFNITPPVLVQANSQGSLYESKSYRPADDDLENGWIRFSTILLTDELRDAFAFERAEARRLGNA
jgi:hypothetical protein